MEGNKAVNGRLMLRNLQIKVPPSGRYLMHSRSCTMAVRNLSQITVGSEERERGDSYWRAGCKWKEDFPKYTSRLMERVDMAFGLNAPRCIDPYKAFNPAVCWGYQSITLQTDTCLWLLQAAHNEHIFSSYHQTTLMNNNNKKKPKKKPTFHPFTLILVCI